MKNINVFQWVIGVFLILLGIGFLGDQFSIFPISQILRYLWPLLITTVGLYLLLKSSRQLIIGLVITLIGVFLLIDTAIDLPFSVWDLWPLIFVAIGLSILFNGRFNFNRQSISENTLESTAVFWGDSKKVSSKNFKGGDINAIFGGCEIDLTEAKFENNEATLNILCLFGGIELKLPVNTVVVNKGIGLFGGFEEKLGAVKDEKNVQKLIIEGLALFGGVSVKS